MPVFFFIDPDILKDHTLDNANVIILAYTFFKTGEEDVIENTNQNKKEVTIDNSG